MDNSEPPLDPYLAMERGGSDVAITVVQLLINFLPCSGEFGKAILSAIAKKCTAVRGVTKASCG